MTARDTGIPVIAIATTARELVSGLMFIEEAGISTPKDLKGKTLGIITKVDALAYTRTILKAGGLTMKDVKVINPGFAQVLFIIEKKVDAAHSLTYYEGVQANLLLAKQGKPPVKFLMYTDTACRVSITSWSSPMRNGPRPILTPPAGSCARRSGRETVDEECRRVARIHL